MEYLLIHPRLKEMCVSSYGITDALFEEGWRTGAQDKTIPSTFLDDFEIHGYTIVDTPSYHEFHIKK